MKEIQSDDEAQWGKMWLIHTTCSEPVKSE